MKTKLQKYESDPVMMLGGSLLFLFVFFLLGILYGIWYLTQQ